MKKFTLYIGLDDKDLHRQVISEEAAASTIMQALMSEGLEGATVTRGRGVYRYADGSIAYENSVIVFMLDFDGMTAGRIKAAAPVIKARLNQEALALEESEVVSNLI